MSFSFKRLMAWILAFVPFIITMIVFPAMPDKIPAHYGAGGNVTRYGSKYELFIMPATTFGFFIIMLLIERHIMKKGEKGAQNAKGIFLSNIMMSLIFTVMTAVFLYMAYKGVRNIYDVRIDIYKVMAVLTGLFWVVIGNILPKLKQNWVVGIRTTWTLKSENCWYKTHRMGGKAFVITGIISFLLSLFVLPGFTGLAFTLGLSLVTTVFTIIYSYMVYKRGNYMKEE